MAGINFERVENEKKNLVKRKIVVQYINLKLKRIKKIILIIIFIPSFAVCRAQAVWNNTSFVHRNNQQILDGKNNEIKLDGFNLGRIKIVILHIDYLLK
jgi:hypothetical protein